MEPNVPHFKIVDSIIDEFKKIVLKNNSGRVFFAPVDVFLGNKNAVQPDVFYIVMKMPISFKKLEFSVHLI